MSKEEYQKYIEQGISTRRNTYRGKELKLTEDFWTSIQNGTFDDIYVGDYIVSNQTYDASTSYSTEKIIWLVADIDNYLHSGEKDLTQHHLTIIPAMPLMLARINESTNTNGGYYGSKMVSGCNGTYNGDEIAQHISDCQSNSILDQVYNTYIYPVFGNNIVKYSNLLADTVDNERTNRWGIVNGDEKLKGASSRYLWYERKLDLMSEVNVYGTTIWSSSGFDTGIDNRQYAIFQLKPEFINSYGSTRFLYWLKGVSYSEQFTYVNNDGASASAPVTFRLGVRPRFLIG